MKFVIKEHKGGFYTVHRKWWFFTSVYEGAYQDFITEVDPKGSILSLYRPKQFWSLFEAEIAAKDVQKHISIEQDALEDEYYNWKVTKNQVKIVTFHKSEKK